MQRRAFVVLGFLLLVAAWPEDLHARSLTIESFDAAITVNLDGTIDVTEIIRPRFTGTWNGIYRTIPVEYRTPQGLNYTLLLDLQRITDEAGNSLRYEQSRERHYRKFKIWVPDAKDATRTVILRYRVQNGLKFFEEHDELYWNVTGDEWQAPIRAASAHIQLPSGITGLRAVAFTGVYGSQEQAARVDLGQSEVTVRTLRRLNFREGLTVAVGWDPGLVRRPGPLAQVAFFLRSNWMFGIPLGVLAVMFSLWYARGRDPRRRPIAPQYAPPEDLTPAELGTLVDNSPDMRDITATLVDLAVRGYLRIEETEEKKLLGLLTRKEYVFSKRKPMSEWDKVQPHERALLRSLFAGGTRHSVKSADLENSFYKYLPGIRDQLFGRLLERGFYRRRPDKVKHAYIFAGVAVGLILGLGGGLLSASLGIALLSAIAAAVLSAASIIGFGWFMPARTLRGTRALEGVLGFEEFLTRVEGDRLERMVKTPEMFEKYLPYAMALGVEKNWARAFDGIYREPPEWYRGGDVGTFHPRSFVSDLGQMSAHTGSAMGSSPRSSGGSGFGGGGSDGGSSGGGSSGGGFGGGGGGGF